MASRVETEGVSSRHNLSHQLGAILRLFSHEKEDGPFFLFVEEI